MRRFARLTALLAVALTLSCGLFGGGEKYEDATLADAMSGAVPSKTNTYRLTTPNVVAVRGGFALLKDGHTVQILSADGFSKLWPQLEGRDFRLLVRKWPNPYPHLRMHAYELNGEQTDVQWVLAESELPLVVDHRLYDTSFYEKPDVAAWATAMPRDLVDKKIWLTAENIQSFPIEVAPVAAETTATAVPTLGADEKAVVEEALEDTEMVAGGHAVDEDASPLRRYVIAVGEKRFELLPVRETGVRLLLEGHEAEGTSFGLGGYVTELYPKRQAESTGLAGRFQLEVFDFGGKYVLQR